MMFLDCPAHLDHDGAVRYGLPAEVERHFIMSSSNEPAESATIGCPAGHWSNGAIESLTWESRDKHDLGSAGAAFRAGRDIVRPNSAPAYYQGRPVRVWLSSMRPRRSRTVSPSRDGNRHRPPGANAIRTPPPRRGAIETIGVTSVASSPVITAQTRLPTGSPLHRNQARTCAIAVRHPRPDLADRC